MPPLTPEEGAELVQIAWDALRLQIVCGEAYLATPVHPVLQQPGAAFVTLKRGRLLRGCIGHLTPLGPLFQAVADCAVAAATRDPRFDSVAPEELDDIRIDISVMSPLETVTDFNLIEIGKHGVYIQKGSYHGVLLPQVAVEMGLDRDQFLSLTCRKAGLPMDAWKQGAIIKLFSAQIFHSELP